MQSRRVLRVTSRVTVEVKEERELHRRSSAGAGAMPGAESGMAPRRIHVDGVIPVRNRIRYYLAYLCQDGCSPATIAWRGRQVNDAACIGDRIAHRPAC